MRHPFHLLAATHHVIAIDLLGFGDSDRPRMHYTAELYIDLIIHVASQVGQPLTAVAVSLSSAYLLSAAARRPDLFRALSVICPTGIEDLVTPASPTAAYRLLAGPVGAAVFAGLVSRRSIDYFLTSMTYADPAACDAQMRQLYYQTAHRPGARWAPICFVTGLLNCDVRTLLPQLTCPVQVVWGQQARTTPPTRLAAFQRLMPHCDSVLLPAGMAVQDEVPTAWHHEFRRFLNEVPQ
jgi:pimeloyl-ACP methyl ester carboxylesterase